MANEDDLIEKKNTELTMIAGAAIEENYIYIAQYLDKYRKVWDDVEYTRLSTVNLSGRYKQPWMAHDRPWKIVSVCVWRSYPHVKRLYVALSCEGEVEMVGPGGEPTIVETIEGAGLNRPWSRFLGYLNNVRAIGSSLYACGGANQVYKRSADTGWILISDEILVDPYKRQSMPSPMDAIRHLHDVAGLAENDIYAAGLEGEIYHFDGVSWWKVSTDTDSHLNAICVASTDDVFVVGAHGTLLRGNKNIGFRSVWPLEDQPYFTSIAPFQGLLYLSTTNRGLYTFDPHTGHAASYNTDLTPDFRDPNLLESHDDVMWCFGFKDLAYFDGVTWTRVDHPDNPKIGS